jgi:UPF0755 protein
MRQKIAVGIGIGVLFLLLTIPWWIHMLDTRDLEPATPTSSRGAPPPTPTPTRPPKLPAKVPPAPSQPRETPSPSPASLRNLTREGVLPRLVYIPEGDPATIFDSLRRQGLPLWISDRFLLFPESIRPGWIRLRRSLSLAEFFRHINDTPRERTRRVVMYSGDSLDDFIKQFSRQTRLRPTDLFEEYFHYSPYIDGGILAGFYRLPYRLTPGPAMAYLTEQSEKRFEALAREYLGSYDPAAFKRYLIIASIIQRESWHEEEMPRIAAVIENRLRRGMKLQIDATLNYGPYSHRIVTPRRIRRDTSRFNTYKYKGLPPEPLGSVTEAALRAALKPAQSDALYFVQNIYGTHDFARTYAEHLANISRIKAERARLRLARKAWERLRRSQPKRKKR